MEQVIRCQFLKKTDCVCAFGKRASRAQKHLQLARDRLRESLRVKGTQAIMEPILSPSEQEQGRRESCSKDEDDQLERRDNAESETKCRLLYQAMKRIIDESYQNLLTLQKSMQVEEGDIQEEEVEGQITAFRLQTRTLGRIWKVQELNQVIVQLKDRYEKIPGWKLAIQLIDPWENRSLRKTDRPKSCEFLSYKFVLWYSLPPAQINSQSSDRPSSSASMATQADQAMVEDAAHDSREEEEGAGATYYFEDDDTIMSECFDIPQEELYFPSSTVDDDFVQLSDAPCQSSSRYGFLTQVAQTCGFDISSPRMSPFTSGKSRGSFRR